MARPFGSSRRAGTPGVVIVPQIELRAVTLSKSPRQLRSLLSLLGSQARPGPAQRAGRGGAHTPLCLCLPSSRHPCMPALYHACLPPCPPF